MLDSDSIVLEKWNFVHEKSLKSLEFRFWKSMGTMWKLFRAFIGSVDSLSPIQDKAMLYT